MTAEDVAPGCGHNGTPLLVYVCTAVIHAAADAASRCRLRAKLWRCGSCRLFCFVSGLVPFAAAVDGL